MAGMAVAGEQAPSPTMLSKAFFDNLINISAPENIAFSSADIFIKGCGLLSLSDMPCRRAYCPITLAFR